jgi:hypothetical protein
MADSPTPAPATPADAATTLADIKAALVDLPVILSDLSKIVTDVKTGSLQQLPALVTDAKAFIQEFADCLEKHRRRCRIYGVCSHEHGHAHRRSRSGGPSCGYVLGSRLGIPARLGRPRRASGESERPRIIARSGDASPLDQSLADFSLDSLHRPESPHEPALGGLGRRAHPGLAWLSCLGRSSDRPNAHACADRPDAESGSDTNAGPGANPRPFSNSNANSDSVAGAARLAGAIAGLGEAHRAATGFLPECGSLFT